MNQDLIERYIYAVTRRLPGKQREDVSRELRGLVEDMLAERCGERGPEEKDIRIVLTELGSPQSLYEKYSDSSGKCLIGQPYYSTYQFVLKVVLSAVAVGMTTASLLMQMLEPKDVLSAVLSGLSMVYNGLLSGFAIVTLLFAFFYRKNTPITQPFNFDDLPPVPRKTEAIPKWECVAGIMMGIIFALVFLTVPQIFCVFFDGGRMIPLFDAGAVQSSWYLIVLFAAMGLLREGIRLQEGRYNRRVMLVSVVANALAAAVSIWWLMGFELMNEEFRAAIATLFAGESEFIVNIFANFQYFFLGVLLFALALDTLEAVWKSLQA